VKGRNENAKRGLAEKWDRTSSREGEFGKRKMPAGRKEEPRCRWD
jgi:hypothetical protein